MSMDTRSEAELYTEAKKDQILGYAERESRTARVTSFWPRLKILKNTCWHWHVEKHIGSPVKRKSFD